MKKGRNISMTIYPSPWMGRLPIILVQRASMIEGLIINNIKKGRNINMTIYPSP